MFDLGRPLKVIFDLSRQIATFKIFEYNFNIFEPTNDFKNYFTTLYLINKKLFLYNSFSPIRCHLNPIFSYSDHMDITSRDEEKLLCW